MQLSLQDKIDRDLEDHKHDMVRQQLMGGLERVTRGEQDDLIC